MPQTFDLAKIASASIAMHLDPELLARLQFAFTTDESQGRRGFISRLFPAPDFLIPDFAGSPTRSATAARRPM
jgi:hypothetical protein